MYAYAGPLTICNTVAYACCWREEVFAQASNVMLRLLFASRHTAEAVATAQVCYPSICTHWDSIPMASLKIPLAYAAAANYKRYADVSRQSNIMKSYTSSDITRLYAQREQILRDARQNGQSLQLPAVNGEFRPGTHKKGMQAGRSHPIYQTSAMATFQFLSPSMAGRPEWDSHGRQTSVYNAPKSGKKGMFTKSFSSGMFEDTSIGSIHLKKIRRAKEMEEKARKALEKEEQYEQIVREQEARIQMRREKRLQRKAEYILHKKAAILIQNHFRRCIAKERVALLFKNKYDRAAILIQTRMRYVLTKRRIERRVKHKLETIAAKKIQDQWNKHQDRAVARRELERRRAERERARRRLMRDIEHARRHAAAMKIQNMVKCRQARKFAELIKKKKIRDMKLKKRKNASSRNRSIGRSRGVLSGAGAKAGVV